MATTYPKRPVFAHIDALRKFERELEELRIEIMSINNLIEMDPKVRAILARKKSEETIERVNRTSHQWEMEQHLRDARDRKRKIHEKAKQIVRQHQSDKGKRPDLVYKTRMRKATDNV